MMTAYATIVGGVAFDCALSGFVLDYLEYRHGHPPRLPLRYGFLGVLVAIPLMILAIILAIVVRGR